MVLGLLLLLTLAGFIDATYLTLEHYMGQVPPCFVTTGCDTVTTSPYSLLFGIYVALYGSLYYLVFGIITISILNSQKIERVRHLAYLSWLGLAAALYFTSLQVFVIQAYCIYCLASASISTLIFIIAQYLLLCQKKSMS